MIPETDLSIPITRRVPCAFCGAVINKDAPGNYRFVSGWAKNRDAGGAHAVTLAEWEHRWACRFCIDRLVAGVAVGQTSLF